MSNRYSSGSAPVKARNSLLRSPLFGAASNSQATAPRNGGVTNDAVTSARTVRRSGMSVRATSHPMGAATAQQMTAMMEGVVQNGSGWSSRVKGFQNDQAGKTGTSQIPVNGQYTLDVWASFVGFLPAKHPKFTMLVVVRKPHYPGSDQNWTLNDGYLTADQIRCK